MDEILEFVDGYLRNWDSFAQGSEDLVPYLRDNKEQFEAGLTQLLQARDPRGPARLVFYTVVQVGGFVPLESDLGRAATKLLGSDFPVHKNEEGDELYFAGHLFFWWKDTEDRFESFPLLEEWESRDFAQSVVIPMYRSTVK